MDALNMAIKKIEAAQNEVATLTAIAPYIVGDPRHFYTASRIYGSVATVCYKVRTADDLRELIAHYPPVDSIAYRGTFSGVKPFDQFSKRDATRDNSWPADGVAFDIQDNSTIGKYPCDEDALSATWYTDTPAGRVNVRVNFHHSGRPDWPHIVARYGKRVDGKPLVVAWEIEGARTFARIVRYSAVDAFSTGRALYWFPDAIARAAFIDTLRESQS